jgi:predicted RNase H-like HicB family nuclease
MVMTKYTIWHKEEEEGGFSGQCLEFLGAISQGKTLEQLQASIGGRRSFDINVYK